MVTLILQKEVAIVPLSSRIPVGNGWHIQIGQFKESSEKFWLFTKTQEGYKKNHKARWNILEL